MLNNHKIESFARRMGPTLKVVNRSSFADVPYKAPGIEFTMEDMSFFSPSENEIRLGLPGIVKMFDVDSEEDLYDAVEYVRGHEEQHRRSTQTDDYAAAIEQGAREVIRTMASLYEGKPVMIRSDAEQRAAIKKMADGGFILSERALYQQVAWLANSVEDGRIERIRSKKNPQFADLRMVFRYRFWDSSVEWADPDLVRKSPIIHLQVLENEILSLATCQLHAKGFPKAYTGTDIMNEASSFIDPIARAVSSGTTRGLVEPLKEICRKLAPYLYDACQAAMVDEKMKAALEKALADLIKSLVSEMPEGGGAKRGEEETDEGGFKTAFPESDLVVTLDDDTYDKLMEKASPGEGDGGIQVRREHPKKPEISDKKAEASDGSRNNEMASEECAASSGDQTAATGNDGSPVDGEDTSGLSGNTGATGRETGQKSISDNSMNKVSSGSSKAREGFENAGGSASEAEASDGESLCDDPLKSLKDGGDMDASADSDPTTGDGTRNGSSKSEATMRGLPGKSEKPSMEKMNASEEKIRAAMKEADERSRADASETMQGIDDYAAHERKTSVPETIDSDKALSKADVSKWFPEGKLKEDKRSGGGYGFIELKREYTLTDTLPPVEAAKGKSLRRRNEKYFRSLQTPCVTNLDCGSIDPSLIYSLGIGNVDVFRREGKSKRFDGCAYILIDNSGSMSSYKRREACKAAAIIEEGFRGLMPFKIAAFDFGWGSNSVVHEVVKGWDESQKKNCCWNYCLHGRHGSGNADGFDIRIASQELLRRPEKKKILIVLSDGEPVEASAEYTALQIELARKAGIRVCGIYFEEGFTGKGGSGEADVFRAMYKRDYVCVAPDQISGELEKIFRKFSRS